MILYVEFPKEYTKKTIRLNDFSKVSGYKISIYNNQMYFYPWQWTMENEIKETIPFIVI